MAQEKSIASHLLKHALSILSDAEREELDAWRRSSEANQQLFEQYSDPQYLAQEYGRRSTRNKRISRKLDAFARTPVHRIPPLRRWWAAAAVVLLLGAGIYFMLPRRQQQTTTVAQTDIPAGKEGAILTLADGTQVSLDTVRNGIIALQGGATAKVADGALIYEGTAQHTVFNKMTTPKGRQFQLVLPDGSKVWLNAASSISYPVRFNGNERKVSVTGEAYFEIAQDSRRPFFVETGGKLQVQVLGTSFNISNYADENAISTTLLEGSIKINPSNTVIAPGQQAVLSSGKLDVLQNVNTDQVIAWKKGIFNFTGMDAAAIFRQLGRWYDIDVRFEGNPPTGQFWGEMSRKLPLSKVLKLLKVLNFEFELKGQTLIIKGE